MDQPSAPSKIAISRFISTLAGAFQAFYLYQRDNKMIDEITQNLLKRFQAISASGPITVGIAPRSFTSENEPVGLKEATIFLASELYRLGFKEIVFRAPLQSRLFFQLLHILINKDHVDAKIEKLGPFIEDGQEKPITLIPMLEHLNMLRLPDETIHKRLLPLLISKAQGGEYDLGDRLNKASFSSLQDLYSFLCIMAQDFPWALKITVQNLTDAAREGFISTERFFRIFPLPDAVKRPLLDGLQKKAGVKNQNWLAFLMSFSEEEVALRQKIRSECLSHSALQDLDLAQDLLNQEGSSFFLGFQLLLNNLADGQPVAIQEKAFKLGQEVWKKCQGELADIRLNAMVSALRQQLSSPSKINLALFPLRGLPIESHAFSEIKDHLLSLGEAALPPLAAALDAEQDRSMRRKLCYLITLIGQARGIDFILSCFSTESVYLLRNMVMIAGDIGHPSAVSAITRLLGHPQKTVRSEAVRSLIKIGNPEAIQALTSALSQNIDVDKAVILEFLLNKKTDGLARLLVRLCQENPSPASWRWDLYKALAKAGGAEAHAFLDSLAKKNAGLNILNAEQREEQKLISQLLSESAL